MNTLAQKIKQRMFALNLNQSDLAKKAGISQVAVHKLVTGKSKRSYRIQALAEALECEPSWLEQKEEELINWREVDTWESQTPLEQEEVCLPYFVDIELSAGSGLFPADESNKPKLRFSRTTLRRLSVDPSNAVCVDVSGNSMEPVLPDKSTVGIDISDHLKITDGAIYAINHDGLLRIKVMQNLPGGGVRLKSYNSEDYPNEDYTAEQAKEIRVIGRVFWYSVLLPK